MDFKKFAKLIMIEQTLFALPFAYLGVLFAGGGRLVEWIWVTLALIAARTAGMSFNRVLDAEIDARNPRTQTRALPAGELTRREVWFLAAGSCIVLIGASFMLNTLCFYLSFAAVGLLFTYSFFKRFTSASHVYLGFVEAAAPIGGYLAVTGSFHATGKLDIIPFVLGVAIMLWISGLDIVYAVQDMEFDQGEGLFSLPARYGREKALVISLVFYLLSLGAVVWAGYLTNRGLPYWVAVICVALIFYQQQRLARREETESAVKEFFQINAFVSVVLFAGTFIDVFLKQ